MIGAQSGLERVKVGVNPRGERLSVSSMLFTHWPFPSAALDCRPLAGLGLIVVPGRAVSWMRVE